MGYLPPTPPKSTNWSAKISATAAVIAAAVAIGVLLWGINTYNKDTAFRGEAQAVSMFRDYLIYLENKGASGRPRKLEDVVRYTLFAGESIWNLSDEDPDWRPTISGMICEDDNEDYINENIKRIDGFLDRYDQSFRDVIKEALKSC